MVCKRVGLQVTDRYCEHIPDRVINVNCTTGMWDVPVITDRTVPANRPDTVLRDKTEKTCLLIDITLPDDSNVSTVETEELSNYRDQQIDVSRMWKVRTNTAPVIIGALGSITKIKPSVAPRSPGGYRATEGHTNEHCTQHW